MKASIMRLPDGHDTSYAVHVWVFHYYITFYLRSPIFSCSWHDTRKPYDGELD